MLSFQKGVILSLVCGVCFVMTCPRAWAKPDALSTALDFRDGVELYNKGQYEKAGEHFKKIRH